MYCFGGEFLKNVIITGATGFIGGWLVETLVKHGVGVTALVCDDPKGIPANVRDKVTVVPYDPQDIANTAANWLAHYDAFYNLGWAGVAPEKKNQVELQLNNIKCTLDAVQFAKKLCCDKFIGIGTVAEYVYCDDLISDKQPPTPADIYGAAKVSAHFMAEAFAREIGQDFIWTIVPSTFGERRNDNNLISYTIRTLLAGEKPTFTPLEQKWDFVYISDVTKALYLIGKAGISGKVYGISSGIYKPLKEYIEEIRDLIDPSLPLGIGERPYQNNMVSSSCVDGSELIADVDFTLEVSFKEGILKTIQYFKEQQP